MKPDRKITSFKKKQLLGTREKIKKHYFEDSAEFRSHRVTQIGKCRCGSWILPVGRGCPTSLAAASSRSGRTRGWLRIPRLWLSGWNWSARLGWCTWRPSPRSSWGWARRWREGRGCSRSHSHPTRCPWTGQSKLSSSGTSFCRRSIQLEPPVKYYGELRNQATKVQLVITINRKESTEGSCSIGIDRLYFFILYLIWFDISKQLWWNIIRPPT